MQLRIHKKKTVAVYKSYIEESCSSFEIMTHSLVETKINFAKYVVGGINDSVQYFMITQIPILKIALFCNNKEIMPGNTVNFIFLPLILILLLLLNLKI